MKLHALPLRTATVILAIAAAVGGAVSASAATIGGVATADLGALDAQPSTAAGVTVTWTPVAQGTDWLIGGATATLNGGGAFQPGDVLRLTLDFGATPAPCEVSQTAAITTTSLSFPASAFSACGTRILDKVQRVAVSLGGTQLAASSNGSLGPTSAELFAGSGTFLDSSRTLIASATSTAVSGTAYAALAIIDLPAGATAASLSGTRASLILASSAGAQLGSYDGIVTTGASDPIRVVVDPLGLGRSYPSIVIDLRANRTQAQWIRAADLAAVSFALTTPQSFGSGATGPATATAASILRADVTAPSSGPSTALDPIALDSRLVYAMPSGEANSQNSLAFCHSFTVTNTANQSLQWSLTFDTSKAPLWGLDPTSAGAFSSTWGFVTTAYSASTHRWTIAGTGPSKTIQSGQSIQGGYCAQNVPMPAIDPTAFTVTAAVEPASGPYYVVIKLTVTSTSQWNVPWQADIDLAKLVCAASLTGHPVSFSRSTGTLLNGSTYRVIGTDGDTRLVSAGQPREFDFLSYSPNGTPWSLPCSG